MNYQGFHRFWSQTALCMLIGLLVSVGSSHAAVQADENSEGELSSLRLKLSAVLHRYSRLCEDYTSLAQNCSATVVNCSAACPEGWLHEGDQCYYFSDDKLNWSESRDNCTAMGSHLTILHNKGQHEALEKEAKTIGGFEQYYWIGLSDMEKEGDWRWVDNTTLKITFWNQWNSEPNNHMSKGDAGEDCVVLDSYTQTWSDVPCHFRYLRICQMSSVWTHGDS